jgi:hypothetical protein
MTNDEREIAWREAFLSDMQKVGIKPVGPRSPPLPPPARPYDPYEDLMGNTHGK